MYKYCPSWPVLMLTDYQCIYLVSLTATFVWLWCGIRVTSFDISPVSVPLFASQKQSNYFPIKQLRSGKEKKSFIFLKYKSITRVEMFPLHWMWFSKEGMGLLRPSSPKTMTALSK